MVPPPPKGFLLVDQDLIMSIISENFCVPTVPGISCPREPPGTGEVIVTPRKLVISMNILMGRRSGGEQPRACLIGRSIS
jgi:hypothetical protein